MAAPSGADAEIVRRTWVRLVEVFVRVEALWETDGGGGAASWLGPKQVDAYPEIERASREDVRPYTDDDGARCAAQWTGSRSISPRSRAGSSK